MQPIPGARELKFGPYAVDLRAGELRKNGTRMRLQEKPLRVLALLAERQGEVVTREELKKHLWPEETFVDFETGLNTAVKKLRGALSDDAENPRFIETIPRRGYRFLGSVEVVSGNGNGVSSLPHPTANVAPLAIPSADSAPLAESPAAQATVYTREHLEEIRSSSMFWIRATVAMAVVVLLATVWWLTPLPDPSMTDIFRMTQTGSMDYVVRPASDGVRLFYVQRSGDHYDLMQTTLNGQDTQKTAAPFPNTLVWDVTSDGANYLITSFSHRGAPAPLWLWPATGGSPAKVGEVLSGSASLSPDGKQIAYHFEHDLRVINVDGTNDRKLATFPDDPDSPVWSPDGRVIRFTRSDRDRDASEIWEIGADGAHLHPIAAGEQTPKQCCGTWTPDGKYFVYTEYKDPHSRLYAIREKGSWWRRSPTGPFVLAAEATGTMSPLVSKDGGHVFYYGSSYQTDLEILDLQAGEFSASLHEVKPAMLSTSRDGQWVSYVQFTTGTLWTSHLDGTSANQIALSGLKVAFPRMSPDNQWIAFTGYGEGKTENVYIISAEGGTPRAMTSAGKSASDPDWSPDGSHIVVDRDLDERPGKPAQSLLSIVDVKTSQITDVPGSEDLHMPRWSPDGKFIAAHTGNRNEMRVFDIARGTWRKVAEAKSVSYPAWSADSAELFYQDLLSPGEPLYRVHLADGAQKEVASFQKELDSGIQRCVFVALTPNGSPIIGFDRSSFDIFGARLILP